MCSLREFILNMSPRVRETVERHVTEVEYDGACWRQVWIDWQCVGTYSWLHPLRWIIRNIFESIWEQCDEDVRLVHFVSCHNGKTLDINQLVVGELEYTKVEDLLVGSVLHRVHILVVQELTTGAWRPMNSTSQLN